MTDVYSVGAATAAAATAAATAAKSALADGAAATPAISVADYERAAAAFEQYLRNHQVVLTDATDEPHGGRLDVLYGYADALAGSGRLQASLEVMAHISRRLAGYAVPLEKLLRIAAALIETVALSSAHSARSAQQAAQAADSLGAGTGDSIFVDPLCCGICGGVLRAPQTAQCGHTFCAECVRGETQCCLCGKTVFRLLGCKGDVLVQRLVEKWWSPEENSRAAVLLQRRRWDEALRACNESLERCPNNFQGLLLRSEVLYWLNHFQSSLADADNALKCRPTSHKAHKRRAHALAAMGLVEEALIAHCLSAAHNQHKGTADASDTIVQDVAILIQRLIVPHATRELIHKADDDPRRLNAAPYNIQPAVQRRRLRRQRKTIANKTGTSPFNQYPQQQHHDDFLESSLWFIEPTTETKATASFRTPPDVATGGTRSGAIAADHESVDDIIPEHFIVGTARNAGHANTEKHFLPHRRKSARRQRGHQLQQREDTHCQSSDGRIIPQSSSSVRFKTLLDRIRTELGHPGDFDHSSTLSLQRLHRPPAPLLQVAASLVDVSDFDCVLCYRTLWKPVVTPCGHTYCLVCLDRCLDYSTHCPLCKFSFAADDYSMQCVRDTLARQYVTRFVEAAMQRFVPDAYRKRQRQEIEREPFVPIFVCTTAFPYVSCPLFVYEARYRLMIRRAIDGGDRQFGIVQSAAGIGSGSGISGGGNAAAAAPTTPAATAATTTATAAATTQSATLAAAAGQQPATVLAGGDDGQRAYSDFGTMLSIRDCVLLANGRTILSTVGGRRFRVMRRGERDGYSTAKVQYIYDEPVRKSRLQMVSDLHANVFVKAVIWYNSLPDGTKDEIVKSFGAMPMLETSWETVPDGPAWAWYIIALLPLGQPLKVEILASTSLEKRLLAINKTLDYVAAQKRRSVCVQSCEGVQQCQALDCCQQQQQLQQRASSSTGQLDGAAHLMNGGNNNRTMAGAVVAGSVRATDIIVVEDDDDHNHNHNGSSSINAMNV